MILHIISSLGDGGAQNQLFELLNEENSSNHDVLVLKDGGIIKEKLNENNKKIIDFSKFNLIEKILFFIFFYKKYNYKYIIAWMPHAQLYAIIIKLINFKRIKIYSNVRQSLDFLDDFKLTTKFIIFVVKKLSFLFEGFIFNSYYASKQHLDRGFKIKRYKIILNKISENLMVKQIPIFPRHERVFFIGHLARFDNLKNHLIFIEMAKKILSKNQNFKFIMGGLNVSWNNTFFKNNIPKEYYGNFELLGVVLDVKSFYDKIDLFCLTSNAESFPNVLIESMARGVPCISSDVGDSKFIINNDKLIFQKKNLKQLISIVENYIAMPLTEKRLVSKLNLSKIKQRHIKSNKSEEYLSFIRC